MDNKLQELTEKLYAEGLEKGKAEGEKTIERAKAQAALIVSQAEQKAAQIEAAAKAAAEELERNTANDVRLASLQALSALRTQIENFVVGDLAHSQVSAAFANGDFTRELIVKAVESWNPNQENGVQVVVPEAYAEQARQAIQSKLDQGVDLVFDSKMRVPFRIAPRDGGYYVSFTDEDFRNLLISSLRPVVSKLLFEK